MWTMTTKGFFSAVAHRDKPGTLIVRARNKQDIDNLAALIPGTEPIQLESSDYHWRIECSKEEYASALVTMALEIDYPNFKNAVQRVSPMHASAYHRVWWALLAISPTKGTNWSGGKTQGLYQREKPIADRLFDEGLPPHKIAKRLGNGVKTWMVRKHLEKTGKLKTSAK